MSQIKNLIGDTAIYGLSSILGRVLTYLLVPLYTTVFKEGEYGVVTNLYANIAFLNIIYTFGLETTFFRFATKFKDKSTDYFRLSFTLLTFWALGLSILIFLGSNEIADVLSYSGSGKLIRWIAIILFIDTFSAIPFAQLRLQGKSMKFATIKLINLSLMLGLNIFFLLILPNYLSTNPNSILKTIYNPELGVGYVFLSNLIANSIYIFAFFPSILSIRLRIPSISLKPVFNYAMPLLVLGLAGVTNEMFSRLMLTYLLPEGFYEGRTNFDALGIFGAVYKLSIFMTLAIQAFKYAFEPFFFNASTGSDSKKLYSKVMSGFAFFGGLAWIIITVALDEIGPIFLRQDAYLEGLAIVPILLGGGLFLGIFYNLSIWYKLTDKTWYGAYITIAGALVTVILNFILIPRIGYLGCAWATFFSYLTMCIISYFWGSKIYHVNYNLFSVLVSICLAGIIVYYFSNQELSIFKKYILGITFATIYGLIIYLINKNSLTNATFNR